MQGKQQQMTNHFKMYSSSNFFIPMYKRKEADKLLIVVLSIDVYMKKVAK
jgi:hypothetical protein